MKSPQSPQSPQSPLTRRLTALVAVASLGVMTLIGGSCSGSAEAPNPPSDQAPTPLQSPAADATGGSAPPSTAPRPKSNVLRELEAKLKPNRGSVKSSPPSPTRSTPPSAPPGNPEQPPTKPVATAEPGGGANGESPAPKDEPELTEEKLAEEATAFFRAWVKALDRGNEKELLAMSIDAKFLEENVDKGTTIILKGTLIPKNSLVIRELVRVAKDKTVKLAEMKVGSASIPDPKTSIFSVPVPVVTGTTLEVEIGEHRAELGVRQAVRTGGKWKVMEIVVTK